MESNVGNVQVEIHKAKFLYAFEFRFITNFVSCSLSNVWS